MADKKRRNWKFVWLSLVVFSMLVLLFIFTRQPSNGREWAVGYAVMPYGEIEGDVVSIYNIRNFTWISEDEALVSYFNESFNLSSMDKGYFLVETWMELDAVAHIMFSFEYGNGSYFVVSVESRKEKGEKYSSVLGFFNKYELIYVIGSESDLLPLRTYHRGNTLYMYPINATPEDVQKLFVDILERVNSLYDEPEWYHAVTSSCTTNLIDHAERMSPRIKAGRARYFPGYSDKVAYELGLIDTELPYEQIRTHFNVTSVSAKVRNYPDFSKRIRETFE